MDNYVKIGRFGNIVQLTDVIFVTFNRKMITT